MSITDRHPLDHELGRVAERLRERALVAQVEVESRLFGAASVVSVPPRIADRYRLMEPLGRGGQGEVWRAWDERLDREVAVKRMRLHPGMSMALLNDSRAEAQALARLQHSNVVSVFDLGLDEGPEAEGSWQGAAYIVMELVPGASLDRWLAEHHPSVPEILVLARQVAAGLGAAHEIGLHHRDVKPANVLVGDDGRARVADFGLATMDPETLSTGADAMDDRSDPGGGGVVGTLAYMAPEQQVGATTDARADQFAFAMTLFEVLYGVLPYHGDTAADLLDAKRRGPPPQPTPPRLSKASYRALCRGMEPDPVARFEDVGSLVDAVVRAQRRRYWPRVVGITTGGAILAVVMPGMLAEPPCTGANERLVGTWDDAQRQRVGQALGGTEVGFARDTASRVVEMLDGYTADWAEARDGACRAFQNEGHGPSSQLDPTLACYDRALRQVDELVEVLSQADQTIVGRAVSAVASLPSPDRCRGLDSWSARSLALEDPKVAARVDANDRVLDRAQALQRTGKYDQGLALASAMVAEAERLDHDPLLARALVRQGANQLLKGMYADAERTLTQGYALAVEESMPAEAAEAAGTLVWVVGGELARPDEGRAWWEHARAKSTAARDELLLTRALGNLANLEDSDSNHALAQAHRERVLSIVERTYGPDHPLVLKALVNLGVSASQLGEFERSEQLGERALALSEKILGPEHPNVAAILNTMGMVAFQRGDLVRARQLYERALAIAGRSLGPVHAQTAAYLANVGSMAEQQGELDTAQRYFEQALSIVEETLGADHPRVARVLDRLGVVARQRGDLEQARRYHERAWTILQQIRGPEHLDVARSHYKLGNLALAGHDYEEARRQHERALAIREAQLGAEHPLVEASVSRLGRVAASQGHYEQSQEYYARALILRERSRGPDHIDIAITLTGLGQALAALGRQPEAAVHLERALVIYSVLDPDPKMLAETRFALATVLLTSPSSENQRRALVLASQAQKTYAGGGSNSANEAVEVAVWIAARQTPNARTPRG